MNPRIQRFPANTRGRDFVVGDIHGCFSYLEPILEAVALDPESDRLFSVGDLVDRGPESPRALEYLAYPWFHAVLGNHERLLLETNPNDARDVALWEANGGRWWSEQSRTIQARLREAIGALPYVIEVETALGTVGIVHADVPRELSWSAFVAAVEAGDPNILDAATWLRMRAQGRWPHGVEDVYRVYIGHTPCWGEICRVDNVFCLDTGGVFGLHYGDLRASLTLMELTGDMVYSNTVTPHDIRKRRSRTNAV
jgi:serine/threonine protein phosphatase 1